MQKWEYQIIDMPAESESGFGAKLNGLGNQGWEAVGMVVSLSRTKTHGDILGQKGTEETSSYKILFKRPLP
jgi:hypothetical protein